MKTNLQVLVSSLKLPASSSSDVYLLAAREDWREFWRDVWAEPTLELDREASRESALRETVLPLSRA